MQDPNFKPRCLSRSTRSSPSMSPGRLGGLEVQRFDLEDLEDRPAASGGGKIKWFLAATAGLERIKAQSPTNPLLLHSNFIYKTNLVRSTLQIGYLKKKLCVWNLLPGLPVQPSVANMTNNMTNSGHRYTLPSGQTWSGWVCVQSTLMSFQQESLVFWRLLGFRWFR